LFIEVQEEKIMCLLVQYETNKQVIVKLELAYLQKKVQGKARSKLGVII